MKTDKQYIDAARLQYESEGEVEFDDDARISHGDDPGAYVQAWVWVNDNQVRDTDETE